MDVYRKGGDSLQGRYHHYRLHPFSIAEISGHLFEGDVFQPLSFRSSYLRDARDAMENLLKFGGFPEPFLEKNEEGFRRWHDERMDRFIYEDVRDLENIRDLSSMELLTELLVPKAAFPLSLNSLREDLEVSHRAITHWIDILERLYYIFRIYPFTGRAIRSLKKESKVYLWDYSMISDRAAKFENLVACHLLKFCHFLKDVHGFKTQLYYLRDVDKREVDFLVTVNEKPWFAVEAKMSDHHPSSALNYFGERMKISNLYQVVLESDKDFLKNNIRIISAIKFLDGLV